ncbi:MAG: NAD(P)-dependent dehydrogenase (short-subunit alcohol dehydrogenase family) [Candidatus Latescibacterota bacterium]|jgi:NAD(P)-dependent dehydrogenase (short-subunit alcohol dehydrogenase family)
MLRFTNKVALVTGGGTGIGRAVAKALVAEGARVVVTGRREEPLKQLAAEFPDSVRYITMDVTEKGAPANAVRFVIEQFQRLDVLVNNAGMGALGPLAELGDDAIQQTFAVNVEGVLITTREAIPSLSQKGGAVVNISSTLARASMPGTAAYSGSKAAMERITSALAVELGPQGIRVNAVAPGVTKSDMSDTVPQEMLDGMVAQTPLGRMGQPEDIARAVVFLASDDASWITGQVLQSSGGLML